MASDVNPLLQIVPDFGDVEKSFDGMVSSLTRKALGLGAILGSAFALNKIVDAAIDSEKAVSAFNKALGSTGHFTAQASAGFQEFASSMERLTNVQDEVILRGGAMLASFGKLSGEGLTKASKAALDLASALQIGPEQAFDIMTKAANGNTMALDKYGFSIKANIPQSEKFAEVLKQIEARFGGNAAKAADTFGGALEQIKIQFGNIAENLGLLLQKSPVLRTILKDIGTAFFNVANALGKLDGKTIDNLILKLIEVGRFIAFHVIRPVEFLKSTFEFATQFIAGAIQEFIIIPLANVGLAVTKAMAFFGKASPEDVQFFTDIRDASVQALDDINKKTLEVADSMDQTPFADSLISKLDTIHEKLQMVSTDFTGFKDKYNQDATEMANTSITVGGAFSNFADGFDAEAKKISDSARKNFQDAGAAALRGFGNAGGQAFAAFGKAIATGQNALQAFINSLLASMGQMAIQLGSMFILQGLAYMWAGLPNGGSLIAAGAALAAFGGILSAVGGGGGAGMAGGGSAGGAGQAAPVDNPLTEQPQQALQQTQQVQVIVQGNILDRRETGLAISEIIQESFDSQRTRVVGAV